MNRAARTPNSAACRGNVLIAILALACSITQAAESASDSLCVATYNLRFASSNGPNAWPDRRPIMRELIQKMSPDLLGTQEGVYYQLQDLAADLPDYAWVGTGREGGLKGEFMAIFYRKARLQPLSTNHFWLSDTPEVPASSTWGNKHFRMVTWMKVRDLQTRREFYFFNTHFDHLVQVAREKSAALVRQRITDLNTSLPVILTGDFNAIAGRNKAYDILVGDGFMFDTWGAAKRRTGEGFATFNGFKAVPKTGEHIDWILARGAVSVDSSEVSTFSKDGQFPSDHCPVLVQVRLGPARTQ